MALVFKLTVLCPNIFITGMMCCIICSWYVHWILMRSEMICDSSRRQTDFHLGKYLFCYFIFVSWVFVNSFLVPRHFNHCFWTSSHASECTFFFILKVKNLYLWMNLQFFEINLRVRIWSACSFQVDSFLMANNFFQTHIEIWKKIWHKK